MRPAYETRAAARLGTKSDQPLAEMIHTSQDSWMRGMGSTPLNPYGRKARFRLGFGSHFKHISRFAASSDDPETPIREFQAGKEATQPGSQGGVGNRPLFRFAGRCGRLMGAK